MDKEQMRQYLIANPQISKDILEGIPISLLQGDSDMGREIARTHDKGFQVICEVDDDELTPEERQKKAADLADMAIRMMERMGIIDK